jgi:hypothetical protein
LYVAVIV